jgi:hypothetical protein
MGATADEFVGGDSRRDHTNGGGGEDGKFGWFHGVQMRPSAMRALSSRQIGFVPNTGYMSVDQPRTTSGQFSHTAGSSPDRGILGGKPDIVDYEFLDYWHHRNGATGTPFFVDADNDNLVVAFTTGQEATWSDGGQTQYIEVCKPAIEVPLERLRSDAEQPLGEQVGQIVPRTVTRNGDHAVVVFDTAPNSANPLPGTAVAICDLTDDTRANSTAVIVVDRATAGNVRFGSRPDDNSWRGDRYHHDIRAAIEQAEQNADDEPSGPVDAAIRQTDTT